MTHTVEPRVAQGDEQQAIHREGALRLKADTSLSSGDHWDQSDASGAGVSSANVHFEDVIFADEPT